MWAYLNLNLLWHLIIKAGKSILIISLICWGPWRLIIYRTMVVKREPKYKEIEVYPRDFFKKIAFNTSDESDWSLDDNSVWKGLISNKFIYFT